MSAPRHPGGSSGLAQEIEHWRRREEEDRDLRERIAEALGEIKSFLGERRVDLERRKSKVLQTSAFKDETRAMEAALAAIEQNFAAGRNISRIFADIDRYLKKHRIDDTLSRLHTRTQLADARDEFMCTFHDSIHGTRLAELLDVLYFMPFAYWRLQGLEQRNYRSPSAAELLGLLGDLRRRGVDASRMDAVLLATIIRVQLGITPRMDYHHLSGNRLAEQLTDGENLTRFTSRVTPPDESFCRAVGGTLANLRRCSAEVLAAAGLPTPPAIEAEMLQIVVLSAETLRLGESVKESATDYLWLLSTVIASDYATLKDTIARPDVKDGKFASVTERILGAKTYLERTAVLADALLAARWTAAREELRSLTARSEAICAKESHSFAEFTELEQLKERRSEIGKSLIKITDSLQLLEPALLDMLAAAGSPTGLRPVDEHVRALDPGRLIDRNRSCADETRQTTRQELEKLRALIGRLAEISRKGFASVPAPEDRERPVAADRPVRRTSDGRETAGLPAAEVDALLLGALGKALDSMRDFRSRVDGARKRTVRSDLLQFLNVLGDKLRKAADNGDRILSDIRGEQAPAAAEAVAASLRECLTAHTSLSARLASAKLTPAERQPFTNILYPMKARLSDDLRDIETLLAERAERSAEAGRDASGTAAERLAALTAEANRTLKPVKEHLTMLSTEVSSRRRDTPAALAAARGLQSAIAGAQSLMTQNRALVETIAATGAPAGDEHVRKIDRWQRQVEAVGAETERLLSVMERIAEIEEAARIAAAVTEGNAAPASPGPQDSALGVDGPPPSAQVATIARALARLREAREACAAAGRTEWRILKGAAAYLESSGPALDACDAALRSCQGLEDH